ncbi:uncharacterized protein LOC129964246 isoform X2 [Argiope bruennichi]|uniref:uncharacterized protein LOC129964246 isoform X2 n=1 Tax=Argiope bruennichi TaxID=94029 RepID=UPI00249525FA|nr:uncharacterized protein LOC129964246 isoform X2 [Argiope bruennichi]
MGRSQEKTTHCMLILVTLVTMTLIVVLVVVLFVLVIILILFRDSFQVFCCCKSLDSSEVDVAYGLRNPAFDDHEYSNRAGALPEQRPFSVMEAMESPPSYEEAVKQELFRFSSPSSQFQRERSTSLTDIPVNNQRPSSTEFSEINASALSSSPSQREASGSSPSTSQGATRKRSSTAGSNGMPHLSTISEEDSERDERPLRVVIDNIGVQASRLLENCETSINIANGNELDKQSKC